MKKVLSILLITLVTLSASAHNILKLSTCWTTGTFTFKGTQFDGNQKVKLTVDAGFHFSNNTQSYTFTTPSGANLSQSFTVNVYKNVPYNSDWRVVLTCTYGGGQGTSNDAIGSPLTSGDDICSSGSPGLPVTLINFTAHKNFDYTTSVSWTTTVETGNNYFQLEGSNDGTSFHTEVVIFSQSANGNSAISLNYTHKVAATTQSKLILAGMGGLGAILLIGILIGTMKRKHALWLMPLMILVFAGSLVSCQKHVDTPTDKSSVKWKYLRLKQVDKDGTVTIATGVVTINN